MKGNPKIVAENDTHYIIERGKKIKCYGLLKKGEPLSSVKVWRSKKLYNTMTKKANYQVVEPHTKYKE